MLRVWLGMPVVNVNGVDTPSCGADKCKKLFGGDMLSGSHWDSICCGCIPFRNMRHDFVRDIFYHAFLELGVSVQREPKGLYQGSNSRPADLLVPPVKPGECDRALDFVVVNPRSDSALEACSDKGALIASSLAEKKKLKDHEDMLEKYGISSAVVNFQKLGIAFESSGAFGRQALSLWAQLKYIATEIGLDNYIVSGVPHTWSAFTFEQMIPQKISWIIQVKNAEAIMLLSARSKSSRLDLAQGVDLVCG